MWSWPNTTPPWTASTSPTSTAPPHTAPSPWTPTQLLPPHSQPFTSPLPPSATDTDDYHLTWSSKNILLDNLLIYPFIGRTDNLHQLPLSLHRHRHNHILYLYYHTHWHHNPCLLRTSGTKLHSPVFDFYTFLHHFTSSTTYWTYPICSSWSMCRHSSSSSTSANINNTAKYPSGSTTDTTSFTQTYGKESCSGKTTTTTSSTPPNDCTWLRTASNVKSTPAWTNLRPAPVTKTSHTASSTTYTSSTTHSSTTAPGHPESPQDPPPTASLTHPHQRPTRSPPPSSLSRPRRSRRRSTTSPPSAISRASTTAIHTSPPQSPSHSITLSSPITSPGTSPTSLRTTWPSTCEDSQTFQTPSTDYTSAPVTWPPWFQSIVEHISLHLRPWRILVEMAACPTSVTQTRAIRPTTATPLGWCYRTSCRRLDPPMIVVRKKDKQLPLETLRNQLAGSLTTRMPTEIQIV